MHGILDVTIDATQDILRERLAQARTDLGQHKARDEYAHLDTFMASTSRHLAALSAALLPRARQHDRELVDQFIAQSRRLELTLALTKAKLYGGAHAAHATWQRVWTDLDREFEATMMLESRIVARLVGRLEPEEMDGLALRLHRAELHAPTRPHPYAPHAGVTGRMSRRMLATVDRFWDTAEGRNIPEPPHPHDHSHDGLITHYLLADVDPEEDGA